MQADSPGGSRQARRKQRPRMGGQLSGRGRKRKKKNIFTAKEKDGTHTHTHIGAHRWHGGPVGCFIHDVALWLLLASTALSGPTLWSPANAETSAPSMIHAAASWPGEHESNG